MSYQINPAWLSQLRVSAHSQRVAPGGTFFAICGTQDNGIGYIPDALSRGAKTIVIQDDAHLPPEIEHAIHEASATLERVPDIRRALGEYAAAAYDYPAKKLQLIALTGTKGKSTTSFLVEHILRSAGYKTALISTVYNKILDQKLPVTGMTTPQPDYLHAFFALAVEAGVEYVVCEAAAQAFSMQRFAGLSFCAGVFTNFSKEHGEFYATMDDYFAAKTQLVTYLSAGAPLCTNRDDLAVAQFGATYRYNISFAPSEALVCPALAGGFNQYNIAAAVSCVRALLPLSPEQIQQALATFTGVPGRLNRYITKKNVQVFIDYAHNPSSYEAVLGALRPLTSQLIVVFGCGGDRDRTKRPIMGSIAASIADFIVITADNPRSEDPAVIAQEIVAGLQEQQRERSAVLLDRQQAIEYAITKKAKPGAIVALLGKGPEEYQLIGTTKYPFSEAAIVTSLLES